MSIGVCLGVALACRHSAVSRIGMTGSSRDEETLPDGLQQQNSAGHGAAGGIHHVTIVTGNVQRNVDFYAGFLGLRLVKRTAGFEDAAQLHLVYGDELGSPGSLITALVWQDVARGRAGLGQAFEIALAIPAEAMGYWITRSMSAGHAAAFPAREFGEPVLRLSDPDGIIIKLVGIDGWTASAPFRSPGIAAGMSVGRIRGVTWLSSDPGATRAALPRDYGCRDAGSEGGTTRFISAAGDAVDLREASGFWAGAPGPGTIDHVAFRVAGLAQLRDLQDGFAAEQRPASAIKDRRYFTSLYIREPGGILTEFATDGPGMTVDEPAAELGTGLFVPPHEAARESAIRIMLPDFSLPGAPRDPQPELDFVHRLKRAEKPDGTTLVTLHGTGGNEADLMPLARAVSTHSDLLGFRGRSTEENSLRWFRRYDLDHIDQDDLAREAEAFAATLRQAFRRYGLDPDRATALGYSNGANFAATLMLLHPGLLARAIFLRPRFVLANPPVLDLSQAEILVITGDADPYAADAGPLVDHFRRCRARVAHHTVAAGHELVAADEAAARSWLSRHATAPPGSG